MGRKLRKDFRRAADADSERTAEQEEKRRQRRAKKRRGKLRLLLRLMLVAVLVFCVVALFANWKDIAPDSFVSWAEDLFAGTTGGSWPVVMMGESVGDLQEVGGNLVVLTDTATVYYNGNGGESLRNTCAYAKPLMRSNGRFVLLMEAGGNRYRLETRSGQEHEKTLNGTLYTGGVSVKGDVAVVTGSTQSYVSDVTVYSRSGEQRYQWLSSEWMVMDVAFAADGNTLAVVGCRSNGGAMQSTVTVFNLRERDQQPVSYTADNVLYSRVHFTGSGTVIAIGDTALRFVNPRGSLDVAVPLNEREPVGFAFSGGDVAIATRPYGTQDGGTVEVYSATGDKRLTATYEGAFRDVSAMNGSFLVLTDRFVYETGGDGFVRQGTVAPDSRMVGAIDGKPLVLGLTMLEPVVWND